VSNYLTPEEAEEYAYARLNTEAWDDAVDDDGSEFGNEGTLTYKALTMATKIIDRLDYRGDKTDEDQDNEFPRDETDDEVPEAVREACFEIALALLDGIDPQLETDNLRRVSQGYANVRSAYNTEMPAPYISAGVPSPTAWRYLFPYLKDTNFVTMMRMN